MPQTQTGKEEGTMTTHYIYCRAPGTKKALLLMPGGQLTSRRIFAARFEKENAEVLVKEAIQDNEGWFFEARII